MPGARFITVFSLLVACAAGCASKQDHAPLAQQSFSGSVPTASAPDGGGDAATPDAGTDAGIKVCSAGALSVPFSPSDPCDQVASTCSLSGNLTVALCQSDNRFGPCYCQPPPGAGGAGGITGFGTSGSGSSGLGF